MRANGTSRVIVAASLGIGGLVLLVVLLTTLRTPSGEAPTAAAANGPGGPPSRGGSATVAPLPPTAALASSGDPTVAPLAASPSPTVAPLATAPLPSASAPTTGPTAEAFTVSETVRFAENAVAALRMGQLEAILSYIDGGHSTLQIRFAFGPTQQIAGLQLVTTYQRGTGGRSDEYILLDDQAWRRQGAAWLPTTRHADIRAQFLGYLPHPGTGTGVTAALVAGNVVLHYYDPSLDADTALTVDQRTGQPYQLRQALRQSSVVITVNYTGWNTPVQILPPPVATPAQ